MCRRVEAQLAELRRTREREELRRFRNGDGYDDLAPRLEAMALTAATRTDNGDDEDVLRRRYQRI